MDHINNSPNLPDAAPLLAMSLGEPNDINTFSPWEIDFRQIESGAMETKVTVHAGESVTLMNISMSRAVHQTGVSPKGLLTFGLVHPNTINHWQGQETSSAELISFGSSDPFDGVSIDRFRGTTISAKEQNVEFLADALGLNIPSSLRKSARPTVFGQHGRVAAIRRNLELLTGDCECAITSEIEEEIISGLLLAANCDENGDDKSSQTTRSRAVSKAIEIMLAHLDENVPISRICLEAGVSWRTLDRAFSEKFNVGPKKYYLCVRLNRVRSNLVTKEGHESVSDIANSWGFWHLGQFAHDYCGMFGELPSSTCADREIFPAHKLRDH